MKDFVTLFTLFPWSVAVGTLVAAFCSVVGVYVILKRVVFLSIALSEAAACGSTLAMVLAIPNFLGALLMTLVFGWGLSKCYENTRIPRDAVLGVLFAVAGSFSIVIASLGDLGVEEIKSMLYGDLILTNSSDFAVTFGFLTTLFIFGFKYRRSICYSFLDRDFSSVMGIKVNIWEKLFFLSIAVAVSASAKTVGAILVFSYLVIAPSAGLLVSKTLAGVMSFAVLFSVFSTIAGLYLAIVFDLPANQIIVLLLVFAFVACYLRQKKQGVASY